MPLPLGPDPVSLHEVLAARARNQPDVLAFAAESESLTNRQLYDDADRLAAGLLSHGIRHGDRLAIVMPAGLDIVRLFFAAQRLGAAPCLFDPTIPPATTARRTADIRPRLVLTSIAGLGAATAALPPAIADPDDVAFLQPTSGTSGEPRAAVLLQRNVLAALQSARALIDPVDSDVLVGWVPPWHDLGLLRFLMGPVYLGLPCHLVPPAVRTIPQWLATISRVRGTITGAPDFAWRLATRLVDPRGIDLSSLRHATNGGEAVRLSTIRGFESRFGLHSVIRPGYGLAEATLGVSCLRAGEELRSDDHGNVSTGRPLEGVEIRIETDADGVGEILVRSPAVFAGYFDSAEESRGALRDGWLHTGDAGALDESGNLYVLGRKRALLKRGGALVAPRELEEAAQSVEGVRIAAAVGLPAKGDSVTEELVIVVEVEAGHDPLARRVSDAVEAVIGYAPDRVIVQPPRTIPRTSNGKIRHALLRGQLSESSGVTP
jgi:acyl-CoA synthetase (AMP-forming)/AMP-acid ligase II